jgi:hypothetical protein
VRRDRPSLGEPSARETLRLFLCSAAVELVLKGHTWGILEHAGDAFWYWTMLARPLSVARHNMVTHGRRGDRGEGTAALLNRRLVIKTLATSAVLLESACSDPGLAATVHDVALPHLHSSPIRTENLLPGDAGFAVVNPGDSKCEVYCSVTSAVASDTVDVFVSTDHTQGVRLDLYRIGYYQGLGARLVSSLSNGTATPQTPYFSLDKNTGLVSCDWSKTFSFEIDPSWVTGYYLIKITNDDGFESHVPFIMRESGRTAPLLAQASVTTWQAYNMWGDVNLYGNLTDKSVFTGPRGYQVSFDRPFLPHANVWRRVRDGPLARADELRRRLRHQRRSGPYAGNA